MSASVLRRILLPAGIAAIALAAFAAAGVGDDGKAELAARVSGDRGAPSKGAVRELSAASATGVRSAAVRRGGVKVRYYGIDGNVAAGDEQGFVVRCPSSYPRAIGGGYMSGSPLVLGAGSAPASSRGRGWENWVTNLGDTAQPWTALAVCAK